MGRTYIEVVGRAIERNQVGSIISVAETEAKVLVLLGRAKYAKGHGSPDGTYQTRVMRSAEPPPPVVPAYMIKVDGQDLLLDEMERDALYELALRQGLDVHHMLGAPKLRIALLKSQEPPAE